MSRKVVFKGEIEQVNKSIEHVKRLHEEQRAQAEKQHEEQLAKLVPTVHTIKQHEKDEPLVLENGVIVTKGNWYTTGSDQICIADEDLGRVWVDAPS